VLLLAGVWWLVNEFVLAPAVPGEDATAQQCVEFVAHAKGLPRLDSQQRIAFVEARMHQAVEDESFRESFVSALRRSTKEERAAFRANLFDALKPRVLRDVHRFHELREEARVAWLDERLVDYKRLEMLLRTIRIDKHAFDEDLADSRNLLNLIVAKTTASERSLCLAYLGALGQRATEILRRPELKEQFEQRLGFALP
jgi:hypothetical protein